MKLDVLFDDNHVLAVNKPACMPIAPDDSGDESLLDVARAWVEEAYAKPGRAWLGLVHRLDRPVSGVVVFARTSKAAGRLSSAFARREVQKRYVAVCVGRGCVSLIHERKAWQSSATGAAAGGGSAADVPCPSSGLACTSVGSPSSAGVGGAAAACSRGPPSLSGCLSGSV